MTSTSRVGQLRATALPAATALAKGPTGLALFAARQGYGFVRTRHGVRKARPSSSPRRMVLFGVGGLVVAIAVVAVMRRRSEQPPVAAAPPSLADYDNGGIAASSADTATLTTE